jgi:hypothetical protein
MLEIKKWHESKVVTFAWCLEVPILFHPTRMRRSSNISAPYTFLLSIIYYPSSIMCSCFVVAIEHWVKFEVVQWKLQSCFDLKTCWLKGLFQFWRWTRRCGLFFSPSSPIHTKRGSSQPVKISALVQEGVGHVILPLLLIFVLRTKCSLLHSPRIFTKC